MIVLINKTKIRFSFLRTIKCNVIMYLNLIGELNILHLSNYI
jgi:hypothetical protein